MDCAQVRTYLDEYVDGFLTAELRKQIEAHLLTCKECKRSAETLADMRKELRTLRLEDTSDFKFDLERAKAPLALPKRVQTWGRVLTTAAACVVLLVGVFASSQNRYTRSTEIAEGEQEVIAEGKMAARTVEVPAADAEFSVPEGADMYTYFSSLPPASNEKMQSRSVTPEVITGDVTARSVPAMAEESAEDFAVENGYAKRVLVLTVLPEAKEKFLEVLVAAQLADYPDEIVIDETSLTKLMEIDGVSVSGEGCAETDTDMYNGKFVIEY